MTIARNGYTDLDCHKPVELAKYDAASPAPAPQAPWPLPEIARIRIVDLDRDGISELLVQRSGSLTVQDIVGQELFVVASDSTDNSQVGDVAGDSFAELLVTQGGTAFLYTHEGELVPGWPVDVSTTIAETLLADLTGDGKLDVVFQVGVGGGFSLHAFSGDGSPLPGWPVTVTQEGGPGFPREIAAGDLDFDGTWEVVSALRTPGNNAPMFVFNGDGTQRSGFPIETSLVDGNSPQEFVIVDLDGDFTCEILGINTFGRYVYKANGQLFEPPDFYEQPNSVAVGDVTGDGVLDTVIPGLLEVFVIDGTTGARTSSNLPGETNYQQVLLADFTGDGVADIITYGCGGCGTTESTLHFLDGNLQQVYESITFLGGRVVLHALGQADTDAPLELACTVTYAGSVGETIIYELPLLGPEPPRVVWGVQDHDLTSARYFHNSDLPQRHFIRGDLNLDHDIDVSDILAVGRYLFLGASFDCPASADFDGNGVRDVSDFVGITHYLFGGGASPPAPFPDCEVSSSPQIGCQNFVCP